MNMCVEKWPRYYDIQIKQFVMAKNANNHFSSYQVSTKLYNKFHTTFSHTSTKVLKGRRLSFLSSTWRPTKEGPNSSQFVWVVGLAWVTFFTSLFGAREEKRREKRRRDPTSPSCSQEQDKLYPSQNLYVTQDHWVIMFTRSSQLFLTKLMSLTSYWVLFIYSQDQSQLSLNKLMSLTNYWVLFIYSQDQANYPWQNLCHSQTIGSSLFIHKNQANYCWQNLYVTHDHWVLLFHKIKPTILWQNLCHSRALGPFVCKSKTTILWQNLYMSW